MNAPRRCVDWVNAWLSCPALVRVSALVLGAASLWWSSSRPREAASVSMATAFLHNAAHPAAFGVLGVLGWSICGSPPVGFLVAAAYGLVDELHQRHVLGRSCSIVDWVSDCAGAALAIWVIAKVSANQRLSLASLLALVAIPAAAVALATLGPW